MQPSVYILVTVGLVGTATCAAAQSPTAATSSQPAATAWSIEHARIQFTARRGETQNLCLLDRSTDRVTRLTTFDDASQSANNGRISTDGTQIVFQVRRGKNYDIYWMPIAGGEPKPLIDHPAYDVNPVWSPDGRQIAFMSTRGYELGSIGPFPGHIYIVNSDGSGLRQVTHEPLTSSLGPSDWSADGRQLLMARVVDSSPSLFALTVASGRERQLFKAEQSGYSAAFSHDGQRIAFHAETASGSDIVVSRLDGTARTAMTQGGFNYSPRWSPDDEWILFTASDDGQQYDLRAVHMADGKKIALVATDEDEREGDWLP